MKTVAYSRDAAKDLRRHGNVADSIRRAIREYAADPQAHGNNLTQLVGSSSKRLLVGDFRVIFDETAATITMTKIGPRGELDEYLAAATPLAFWRKHVGKTQAALAAEVGISQPFLAQIETGKRDGSVGVLAKIARALRVRIEDLVAE